MASSPTIRSATLADVPVVTDLTNMAGHGMPLWLWTEMAAPGEDPWEVGRRRRAARIDDSQIYVIDEGAGAIACLTGYAQPAAPEPIPDDMPPVFRPLQELENLAPASWYVNVLAVLPAHRGRGLGSALLTKAEEVAAGADLDRLSIIVESANTGAKALYERHGYREEARRPVVDGAAWGADSTHWLLLTKNRI